MAFSIDEALLADHGVAAVRLEYLNLDGTHCGKVVSRAKFLAGIERGWAWPDLAFGLCLGNTVQFGFDWGAWRGELPDVVLVADLDTMVWPPVGSSVARVLASFRENSGRPLAVCPRTLLRSVDGRLRERGLHAFAAVEIEATVFEESYAEAAAQHYRDLTPLGGRSGAMLVMTKSPAYQRFMSELLDRFDQQGIGWEAWSDEAAIGQVEINLPPAPAPEAADQAARVKQCLREVAHDLGHSVTFMAKWHDQEYGQGAHVNVSLRDPHGVNLLTGTGDEPVPDLMRHAAGGLLATLPGFASLAMPFPSSYRRLAELEGPPTTVTWGLNNKSCAVRAVPSLGPAARLEHRLPGADAHPHLVMAGILAGIEAGIENRLEPQQPIEGLAWMRPDGALPMIPSSINRSANALTNDPLLATALGREFIDYWVGTRRWEWRAFHAAGAGGSPVVSEWEMSRYFELV
ncbi:glutamine synthetase family protein [Saccharopolyspora sp. ASAGF58]|uniref:glutamine synthetase family protein n=1 Tax=Saccharopolyspora sp. ASAGF58 TaxID=2719023 RepID=UPI00143FC96C|nr:glutamine synthetase family protein [Saccharopolyspora sp. ASAGF58]QIZ38563.1 glutamine synthetase [Saccharopolyspora sp. ASAGF58]